MIIEVTAHISSSSCKIEVCFDQGGYDSPTAKSSSWHLTINQATELRDELTRRLDHAGAAGHNTE